MASFDVPLVVGPISTWPDSDVQLAYKLLLATIRNRAAGIGPDDGDTEELAMEAEDLGLELVRRGLL
jgi:hypothetical protein